MKVCLVQSLIGAGGGNDIVLNRLFETLNKDKHDVTIFSNSKPLIDLYPNVETRIPIKLPCFGLYQQVLGYKTPKNFKRFDVIIVLSGNMVINTTGKPMYHYNQNNFGDVTENAQSKYTSGIWSVYYFPYKFLLKSLQNKIKKSDIKFIASSKYVAERMRSRYGKEVKVIYPPVNLKEFHNYPKKKQVITVARFSKEKNLEEAVEIMNFLEEPYFIYGTSLGANKLYYEMLRRRIEENVELCNNRPRNELIEKLAESKVCLQTSVETFGISIVEAIASGCIPIVPNNSANIETVPFDELRYNTKAHAITKIQKALNGDYDFLLPRLQEHIQQFDVSRFTYEITKLLGNSNE